MYLDCNRCMRANIVVSAVAKTNTVIIDIILFLLLCANVTGVSILT